MFDIGWTEMALIAVVAVIVIGPKELPKVMRELGTWVARARSMSRVFMDQLEEMSRQSGIDEVRKEAEALRKLNPMREIEKTVDPEGVIARQTSDLAQIGKPLDPPLPKPTPADEAATPPAATADEAASRPAIPADEAATRPATPAAEQPVPQTATPEPAPPPATAPRGPGEGTP